MFDRPPWLWTISPRLRYQGDSFPLSYHCREVPISSPKVAILTTSLPQISARISSAPPQREENTTTAAGNPAIEPSASAETLRIKLAKGSLLREHRLPAPKRQVLWQHGREARGLPNWRFSCRFPLKQPVMGTVPSKNTYTPCCQHEERQGGMPHSMMTRCVLASTPTQPHTHTWHNNYLRDGPVNRSLHRLVETDQANQMHELKKTAAPSSSHLLAHHRC